MTIEQNGPGPIGATCAGCIFGPGNGQGKVLWFCRKTWSIVCARDRACDAYEARDPASEPKAA